ncbi:calcium-binding protein [Planktomarina temperata]|nr:calcium-binding protein [Planktomarina temperata]
MALSLAACGGSDDVAVDITSDNAEILLAAVTAVDATATTVAEVASNANAAGVTAGETAADAGIRESIADAGITVAADATSAEMIAAVAASDNTTVADTAKTTALTTEAGTTYATVDAAFTAGSNTNNADAVAAALTDGAGVSHATVDAAVTSNDTEIANAATAAANATAEATLVAGTGFDTVAALSAAYTSAIAATPAVNETLTSSANIVSGTANDDSITGTQATYGAGDAIIGGLGDDTLTLNMTGSNAGTATVAGVENIVVNVTSFAEVTYDAAGVAGDANTTVTFNNLQAGGATAGTVSNVGSNITVQSGAQMTGTLTVGVSANAESVTVAGGATTGTVAVTNVGNGPVTVTSSKAGTTGSPVSISVDGAGDATLGVADDAAVISASGVVTLETAASDQVEILTVSGNGAAATFNLDATGDAPETVTLAGDQDVTISMTAAQATGETFLNTSTGVATLSIDDDATGDYTEVASSIIIDLADGTTGTITSDFANNASVKISAVHTAATLQSTDNSATSETLNLELDDVSDPVTSLTTSDFETLNLTTSDSNAATDDSVVTVANLVASSVAGTVVNVAGSTNLTLTDAAATKINAADFTGVLTATVAADLNDITGGSGADVFNMIDTDATLVGGDGSDTLAFAASTDLSNNTVSLTGMETITINAGGSAADAAETVTFKSSVVTGKSFIVSGTGANNNDILAVALDATSVDLSSLSVNTTLTQVTITNAGVDTLAQNIEGSNAADTIVDTGAGAVTMNGNGGADVITTNAGVDTIDGGDGADNITAGAGADTVTGGEGADGIIALGGDSIILTEATSAADNVVFNALTSGSAVGAGAGTFTGFNVVTGFATSVDDLVFDDGTTALNAFTDTVAGGDIIVTAGGASVVASTAATTATNDLALANIADVDSVVAFLSDGAYTTTGAGDFNIVAVTFDDFTAVYSVTDAVTGGDIAASEITMIATVDEVLVLGDMIIA